MIMAISITKSKGNVYALIERMIKKILLILIVGIICACTSNTIMKKPDDLIPKDQMIDLLTDMYTAVSAENIKNINEKRKINYFQLVWDKYHIDSSQFNRSSFYYSSKIDEYDKIYEEVLNRLNEMETIIKLQSAEEEVVRDSLKKEEAQKRKEQKLEVQKKRKEKRDIRNIQCHIAGGRFGSGNGSKNR